MTRVKVSRFQAMRLKVPTEPRIIQLFVMKDRINLLRLFGYP